MSATEVLMQDGNKVLTRLLLSPGGHGCLNSLMEEMLQDRDMVVGLDMEYNHFKMKDNPYGTTSDPGKKISLLSLCTNRTCVFIDLVRLKNCHNALRNLSVFLNNKDIVFGCVHKRNDLVKLKEDYSLEIQNVVHVSEFAARVRWLPRLNFFGVRKLASYIGVLQLQPRSTKEIWIDWTIDCPGRVNWVPSREQVECATVDAYAAYKVTKYLLDE